MINNSEPTHLFNDEDPLLMWTILMHPGTYIGTIGIIFVVHIGVHCFKRSGIRPATPKH